MDLGLFKKLVNEGMKLGLKYATLTGFGEPFLDKYFMERVRFLKRLGLYTAADTNGYLVGGHICRQLIDLGFDSIRFSIFATRRDVYKRLHGVDGYDRVVANIEELLKLKAEAKSKRPRVAVYFVEQEENRTHTQEFINFWSKKVDETSVWRPHNWINTYNLRKGNRRGKTTCGRPISGPLQIRWDGKVSACCFDFNGKLVIGDVSGGTYECLAKDERRRQMHEAHRTGNLGKYPVCLACDQLYETRDPLVFSTEERNKSGTSGNTFLEF